MRIVILRMPCVLNHVTVGKIEGRIEVKGRRGRKHRQMLENVKERRGYWKLNAEALDRTLWRTRYGRPVVRRATEWMNSVLCAYNHICI